MTDGALGWVARHRKVAASVSALVIAAGIAVPLAISAAAGSAETGGVPVPAGAAARLRTMALTSARANGDPKPQWIEAVQTTFAKAMAAVGGGDSQAGNPSEDVYVVLMKGNFTANGASVPPGGHAPNGHYWSTIVDARSLDGVESGLTDQPPPVSLQSLGPVSTLA